MIYAEVKFMFQLTEDWIAQQERYEKLIKSYQMNDLTKEYLALKQAYQLLLTEYETLKRENDSLTDQLRKKSIDLEQLQKSEIAHSKQIEAGLNLHVIETLLFHIQAFEQLFDLLCQLDYEISLKEVDWAMSEENKSNHNETKPDVNLTNEKSSSEADPMNEQELPRRFNFKDLKSYQKAYILPEPKEDTQHQLKMPQVYYDKKKVLMKLKEKQLQRLLHSKLLQSVADSDQAKDEAITNQHEPKQKSDPQKPADISMTEVEIQKQSVADRREINDNKQIDAKIAEVEINQQNDTENVEAEDSKRNDIKMTEAKSNRQQDHAETAKIEDSMPNDDVMTEAKDNHKQNHTETVKNEGSMSNDDVMIEAEVNQQDDVKLHEATEDITADRPEPLTAIQRIAKKLKPLFKSKD